MYLRLLRHRGVLAAIVTGLLAGTAGYLMISMIIRFVQTPTTTGYGLGASVVVAGVVLLPVCPASFGAGKLVGLGLCVASDRPVPRAAALRWPAAWPVEMAFQCCTRSAP